MYYKPNEEGGGGGDYGVRWGGRDSHFAPL